MSNRTQQLVVLLLTTASATVAACAEDTIATGATGAGTSGATSGVGGAMAATTSGATTSSTGAGGAPNAELCAAYASAVCTNVLATGVPFRVYSLPLGGGLLSHSDYRVPFGDDAGLCAQTLTKDCNAILASDPEFTLTSECVGALESLTPAALAASGLPNECVHTHGSKPDGDACGASSECVSGHCTGPYNGGNLCGNCEALKPEGAACNDIDPLCEDGLWCVAAAPGQAPTCQEGGNLGDPCIGGRCRGDLSCESNTCTLATAQLGDTCDQHKGCDHTEDLFCASSEPHTCHSYDIDYPVVDLGEACQGPPGSAILPQCRKGWCDHSGGGQSGICVPLIDDGEPCDVGTPWSCWPGSTCSSGGVCTIIVPPACGV